MFGSFFKTTEVDQFADWVVVELNRSMPPGFDLKNQKTVEQVNKLNDRIEKRTVELAKETRLNIYKKAHLGARVREGMTARGYPEQFVKSFSFDLLARIQAALSKH